MSWRWQASPRRSSIPPRRKASCWSAATPRRRTIFIAASPGRDFKRRFQLALSVPSPSNNSPQGDAATGASFGHHSKCIGRRCNHVRPDQLLPCHCRRGPFAHHHLRAVSDSECCAGADEPALSRGLPIQESEEYPPRRRDLVAWNDSEAALQLRLLGALEYRVIGPAACRDEAERLISRSLPRPPAECALII